MQTWVILWLKQGCHYHVQVTVCSRHNELYRGGNSRFLGGLRNLHTQEYAETTLRDEASPTPKKDEGASKKAGKRLRDALGSSKKLHDTQEGIKQNKQMVLKKKKSQCEMEGLWERY